MALGQGCGLNMTENSTMSTTAPPPITTTTASSAVNNSVNSLSLMWDWWCNFGVYVVAAGPLLNEDLTQTFLNFSCFAIRVLLHNGGFCNGCTTKRI
jgi:hypothetical protein